MRFQQRMTVCGMKASKGQLDDGTKYDSTKLYALGDLDGSRGNAYGQAGVEYAFGTSDEIERFKSVAFPFAAVVDFELVTNGKTQKTIVVGVTPEKTPPKA